MPPHLLHTYHHAACSTLLLCSPYALPSLPRRAPPSLDRALILPIPALLGGVSSAPPEGAPPLPSLLAKEMKLARRAIVVRRADGFEKRREWRCGRCGGVVGYEILAANANADGGGGAAGAGEGGGRVMYFFEGALVGEEEMGEGGG